MVTEAAGLRTRLGENILVLESEGGPWTRVGRSLGLELGYLRVRKGLERSLQPELDPGNWENCSVSGGRGTTPRARCLKKGVGWKLILERRMEKATVFQLLLISRIVRWKGM